MNRVEPAPGPASLLELFLTFNRLALHGFGGVLPWAQRVLVEERRWLGRDEFVDGAAILQAGKKKHRRIVLT